MKTMLKALIHDEAGTSAVEMGLICALIVLALLSALQGFAAETQATWTKVSSATHDAVANGSGA
ncbi:MAG: Flp family type IVb pilin [Novosphingobium sp.]